MRQFSLRHSQNALRAYCGQTSEALLTYDTKISVRYVFRIPRIFFITYIYLSGMCRANQLPEESSPFII